MIPKFITSPDPKIYESSNYAVVDLETTSIDYGDPNIPENELLLACAYFPETNDWYSHWGNEWEQRELERRLQSVDFFVAQNGKFELGWFRRCGIDISKLVLFDTMIAEYVINANKFVSKDLDSLAKRYNAPKKDPYVKRLIDLGVDLRTIPRQWVEDYCKGDVLAEWLIFQKQLNVVNDLGVLPHVYTRCLFTPVLTDIEANGMCLDKTRVLELHKILEKKYLEKTAALREFTGGINQNSPKQVAAFLYDELKFAEPKGPNGKPIRTAAGSRTTDKKDLAKLVAKTKRQKEFLKLYLEQAKVETQFNNYLEKFKNCVEQDNGILQFDFNQTVTKTHRLSSSGKKHKVQGQNMARDFKPLFTTRFPGWKVGEADEAQLEFRTAVWLGNDRQGRLDIANNADVHSFTASILHHVTYEEVVNNKKIEPYSTWRQDAKEDTFKPLYGGESGTEDQMRYYKAFREKYVDITNTQVEWTKQVLVTKKLVMPHGFIFYFPHARLNQYGQINDKTNIYNYPVQHLATAEIVPIGVIYLWHRMKDNMMESFLVNTVHDSAIGEIHPDEEELFGKLAVQALTVDVVDYMKTVYKIDFDVPLEAELSFGTHWGEKKGWSEKWGLAA